ncbi:MAG: dienelactone hydrolase family protein [Prochlorococcaceae cyanobacterium]
MIEASWLTLPATPATPALRCWWARPAQGSPRAGVLVLPEVFGINGWIRATAERLAAEGYGALAMPCFARTAPDLDLPYDEAALAEGRRHRDAVNASELLADAAVAAAWLQGQAGLEGRPIGCVGFCFGGHLAMLAATLPAVAATVDCYGARVASFRPGGGTPTLELVPQIPGRLLCVRGSADPLIPPEEVAAVAEALEQANASSAAPGQPMPRHRLLLCEGGGHGFLCDDPARGSYHPASAALTWEAMLALFGETIG